MSRGELVYANRILSEGVLDTYGHVSARSREDASLFLMSAYKAPALVEEEDIQVYSVEDGELAMPASYTGKSALERFIHAGLYAVHPAIQAVVHCHTPIFVTSSIMPPGQGDDNISPLVPVLHIAASLGAVTPVYDSRQRLGEDSDLLIKTLAMGRDLAHFAASYPGARLILMRGHGATVYSTHDLIDLVSKAVYAKQNAEILRDASLWHAANVGHHDDSSAGHRPPLVALSAQEIAQCDDYVLGAQRSWQAWTRIVDERRKRP